MLELLGIGAVAFGVGLSGALIPGPLTVLVMREAPRRGWRAGPLATLGHGVVELALVIALALGLSAFVKQGTGTAVIAIVGGALLIWMGVALLRSVRGASLDPVPRTLAEESAVSGGGAARVALAALPGIREIAAVASLAALVSIANPYWVVWWATVGTKLTADSLSAGWSGPAAFFVGHILSDLVWLTAVAVLVSSGRRWFGGDGWYRGLLAGCGIFLVAIGALFLVGGARSLA
ncbi:MAG: LysE family transporter [Chloroflexi bacterium]|nr:LysE family transporter [Chloroflexota bacterium]